MTPDEIATPTAAEPAPASKHKRARQGGGHESAPLASQILDDVKARAGRLYDELSQKERAELETAVADLAQLQIDALFGVDVAEDVAIVQATIQNLTVAGQVRIVRHLRDAAGSVVQGALALVLKAIPAAL